MQLHYRQGDVLLAKIDKLPSDAQTHDPGARIILAHGETTGHAHAINSLDAILYSSDDQRYLVVTGHNTQLVHEEHAPIKLPVGIYRVVQQREYVAGYPPGWVID